MTSSCFECVYYPPVLDAIRNIAFDMKAEDVSYDSNRNADFKSMYNDACLKDILRGFVPHNCPAADLMQYGVETLYSLPPFVNGPNRTTSAVPSTRKFGPNNVDITERGMK